jgi:hypothetical protein
MGLNPFYAGDGRTWPNQAFLTDSGIFSLAGLSGSAIALHTLDLNNDRHLYICTGTWAIVGDGSAGLANFTPSAADLLPANPLGRVSAYLVYPVVTVGGTPVAMDGQLLNVTSEP